MTAAIVRRPFHSSCCHYSQRLSTRPSALQISDINPAIFKVQYAVRGELAIKADWYGEQLKRPNHGLPFEKVIPANIGNPQVKGLDQKPITFTRQVAALTSYPPLIEIGRDFFPADVIARAKELCEEIGSVGAYSHSQGVPFIRKNVAKFIQERDGYPSDPNNIFLTAGASEGASLLINMLITGPKDGILIPIPQYPLYTASLSQYSGIPIPYFLNERSGWSTEPVAVEEAVEKAIASGVTPKALVVINPGNPTGSLLTETTIAQLVQIAEKYSLILLADEVYQDNLHHRTDQPFVSFKKTVSRLKAHASLISFHSISKGVMGECGLRGGYFETTNISPEINALIYKMRSIAICPPVSGQIGLDCLVRPPKVGEPSYALWKSESDAIHRALASRTRIMAERLNALEGVSCVDSPGALYLFPRIVLPQRAIEAAQEAGKEPDVLYSLELLDKTGICTVPGSGFGQKRGEFHFRLTCLCEGVDEYVGKLEEFHRSFLAKYAD